jgi:large subunit ribosomal protein L35
MHKRAGKRHLLEHKSSRVTRRLSGEVAGKKTVTMTAKRMLGLK